MTMYRDKPPGQGDEPEFTTNAPDDARGYNAPAWSAAHALLVLLAVLMIGAALLWLGELIGVLAAVLPGGQGPVAGALWGALGMAGVVILLVVISLARRGAGRRR